MEHRVEERIAADAPLPRLSARRLDGKVTLVVGASSGIGRAACLRFAAEGAQVIVASDRLDACEAVEASIRASGAEAWALGLDVSDPASVAAAGAWIEERFGRLDCAFNNAGVQPEPRPIGEQSEAEWAATLGVNLLGVWRAIKMEGPLMTAAGGGAIVNTASVGGLIGSPGGGPYIASKHGVIGLTRTAAMDYTAQGIRVNAIAPGATNTPMFAKWLAAQANPDAIAAAAPIGRFAEPEEIAGAAAWLLSDDASFVVGVTLPVDGGYLVP
jgi:NAD(P)-dependent dehydrogenase (short-subunit alcohol dehydrogenase family)